jgi:hypothetical protein
MYAKVLLGSAKEREREREREREGEREREIERHTICICRSQHNPYYAIERCMLDELFISIEHGAR